MTFDTVLHNAPSWSLTSVRVRNFLHSLGDATFPRLQVRPFRARHQRLSLSRFAGCQRHGRDFVTLFPCLAVCQLCLVSSHIFQVGIHLLKMLSVFSQLSLQSLQTRSIVSKHPKKFKGAMIMGCKTYLSSSF